MTPYNVREEARACLMACRKDNEQELYPDPIAIVEQALLRAREDMREQVLKCKPMVQPSSSPHGQMLSDAAQAVLDGWESAIRALPVDGTKGYFYCPDCKSRVAADEDGCCVSCGVDCEVHYGGGTKGGADEPAT